MRNWLLMAGITVMAMAACAPAPPQPAASSVAASPRPAAKPIPADIAPLSPPQSARATRGEFSGITLEGVAFDARSHRLVVADQPNGPGSLFADAADAARSRGALAAANAGFFTPAGDPLGLVVAANRRAGSWNAASSLGSGVWFDDGHGRSAITRRESLGASRAGTTRELIQAGPLLMENGRAVAGLDPLKANVRSLLLWDGGHRWWLGRASHCTLAQLAAALAHAQPAAWPPRHALNLDGGRSCDLWVSADLPGGPISHRPPWNRPVRNFLLIIPLQKIPTQ